MLGLFMASWYFFSIILLYLFLKRLRFSVESLGSMGSTRTEEIDMRSVCYLMCIDMRRYRSSIENESDKELKVCAW
jgi:hypothetical protein